MFGLANCANSTGRQLHSTVTEALLILIALPPPRHVSCLFRVCHMGPPRQAHATPQSVRSPAAGETMQQPPPRPPHQPQPHRLPWPDHHPPPPPARRQPTSTSNSTPILPYASCRPTLAPANRHSSSCTCAATAYGNGWSAGGTSPGSWAGTRRHPARRALAGHPRQVRRRRTTANRRRRAGHPHNGRPPLGSNPAARNCPRRRSFETWQGRGERGRTVAAGRPPGVRRGWQGRGQRGRGARGVGVGVGPVRRLWASAASRQAWRHSRRGCR